MITVLRKGTTQVQMDNLISWLRAQGLDVHISQGHDYTILGLIGGTGLIAGGAEAIVAAIISTPVLLALFKLKK